jgi:AraC family transcriptional regulator, positive regulator of tynA and feaB
MRRLGEGGVETMNGKPAPRVAQPRVRYFDTSTIVVPPHVRREFWRFGVLNRTDADFHDSDLSSAYEGRMCGVIGPKSEIRDGRTRPIILKRSARVCRRDGNEDMLLSAVLHADDRSYNGEGDSLVRLSTGDIVVQDFRMAGVRDVGDYREVNFRIARPLVAAAIGRDPGFLSGRVLPKTPLTLMLFDHLRIFVDALPKMEDAEREAGLETTTEFGLQTLGFVASRFAGANEPPSDRLFDAAKRIIERNLGVRRLSPEWLAAKLECSRTTVYRMFRAQGLQVMEYVAERRLARAFESLVDPNNRLPIADIAASVGFDEPSTFSRLFRRRFGCTPREARAAARSAAQ